MTMDKPYKYTEHQRAELHGFEIVDATSEGPRPARYLMWVGHGISGAWLTTDEAREIAASIAAIAAGIEQRQSHDQGIH